MMLRDGNIEDTLAATSGASDEVIPDFRGVESFSDIQARFFRAARSIMLEHRLVFGIQSFDVTALELYLKLHRNRAIWWDGATDKYAAAEEQFNRATWYVMNAKGPGRCRIDITAGCKSEDIQAGILIRQLNGMSGPSKALQSIVRGVYGRHSWTPEERACIAQIHGKRIDGSDGSLLRLERRPESLPATLYQGKRINIPPGEATNFENIRIADAALRVATNKKWPDDAKLE